MKRLLQTVQSLTAVFRLFVVRRDQHGNLRLKLSEIRSGNR